MAIFRKRKQRTDNLERPEYDWIWKPLLALVALYLLICIGLGIWWSQRPASFDVEQAVAAQRGEAAATPAARGAVSIATLMTTIETLLDKPGGYLRNDIAPPGLWLDNMPSWEYGVLSQARLLVQAMPKMSSGGTAKLTEAGESLSTDSHDWFYPSAEKRYADSLQALNDYLIRLSGDGEVAGGFTARGDGLALWLEEVGRRFDALTRRLSASIDDPETLRELGVNEGDLPESTPWHHIDNTFFEARGDAWALLHLLKGVQRDYADVIAKAGATGNLERLIAELEMAQRRLWSPVVLNGSGFGIFANHSLVLANYTVNISGQARRLAARLEGIVIEGAQASGTISDQQSDSDQQSNAVTQQGNGADQAEEAANQDSNDEGQQGNAAAKQQEGGDEITNPNE